MVGRAWLVIPAMGVVAAVIALARDASPIDAALLGLAGAAIAAAARGLAAKDASPADVVAAVIAATLAAFGMLAVGGDKLDAIAIAAASFAIGEVSRPTRDAATPDEARRIAAVIAAFAAAALDPRFAALPALAALRLVAYRRPRFAIAAAGIAVVALAAIAAFAWEPLWRVWTGEPSASIDALRALTRAADALGPITAVAATAGLVIGARRGRAGLALCAIAAGALAVDLRCGSIGASTMAIAAVAAGLAAGRLAAMIRIPVGQAIAGATIGWVLILPLALAR